MLCRHARIAANTAFFTETLELPPARRFNPFTNRGGKLTDLIARQFAIFDRGDFDMDERITLPKLEMKDATIEDAVKILIEQSRTNDPKGEGKKIILRKIPQRNAQASLARAS